MSAFSDDELAFLTEVRLLGRLATVDGAGRPHLVPVGWRYNPETDTIDVTGRNFAATKKFRNVLGNPNVAFLVDDVLPPWRPRSVMVQGTATAVEGGDGEEALIRIRPDHVVSWGALTDR